MSESQERRIEAVARPTTRVVVWAVAQVPAGAVDSVSLRLDGTAGYLDDVRSQADAFRASLGFLPNAAYEQAAAQGRLWVSIDRDGKYVGHLLFGGARPSIRVFQITVLPSMERRGIARAMLTRLERYGEEGGFMSVLARVAADLPANVFWERMGYSIVRQIRSDRPNNRTINLRGKSLKMAGLFGPDALRHPPPDEGFRYSDRPVVAELNYALDLNVIFDILRRRTGEALARNVIRMALSGPYRLFLTAEAATELERTSVDPGSDTVLRFVADLPALPRAPMDTIARTVDALADILYPRRRFAELSANQQSDILHLSQCVHHGLRGFITSDKLLLSASERIRQQLGIEVISPLDLHPDAEAPKELFASAGKMALAVRHVNEVDRASVEALLVRLGVPSAVSSTALQPVVAGSSRARLLFESDAGLLGYCSWDGGPAPTRAAYFFADEASPLSARVVDSALAALVASLPTRRLVRIDLWTLAEQMICRETASLYGYQQTADRESANTVRLSKVAYRGPVFPEEWARFVREFEELTGASLAPVLPSADEFANTGVMVATGARSIGPVPLFEFETLVSPVAVLAPKRMCVVVPVRHAYAESLLGAVGLQQPLLPREEAALFIERAYFRSPRGVKLLRRGDIVLFYVSSHDAGGKELVASARVTSSSVMSVPRAELELSRQGVLSNAELRSVASTSGQLHAFTFDNATLLPTRVPLLTLKKEGIVDTQPLVCPFRLRPPSCAKVFRLAYGLTP